MSCELSFSFLPSPSSPTDLPHSFLQLNIPPQNPKPNQPLPNPTGSSLAASHSPNPQAQAQAHPTFSSNPSNPFAPSYFPAVGNQGTIKDSTIYINQFFAPVESGWAGFGEGRGSGSTHGGSSHGQQQQQYPSFPFQVFSGGRGRGAGAPGAGMGRETQRGGFGNGGSTPRPPPPSAQISQQHNLVSSKFLPLIYSWRSILTDLSIFLVLLSQKQHPPRPPSSFLQPPTQPPFGHVLSGSPSRPPQPTPVHPNQPNTNKTSYHPAVPPKGAQLPSTAAVVRPPAFSVPSPHKTSTIAVPAPSTTTAPISTVPSNLSQNSQQLSSVLFPSAAPGSFVHLRSFPFWIRQIAGSQLTRFIPPPSLLQDPNCRYYQP